MDLHFSGDQKLGDLSRELVRLTRKTYADTTQVNYTHDTAGRLATRTWARGVVTTYTYDLRDRLTGVTYSDGTPAVVRTYDADGRMSSITNGIATSTYTYDDAGQLGVETQAVTGHPLGVRTLTSSYDNDGLRTGLIYPSGKPLATTHTARGQLATVAFNAQNVATYIWRTNGQPLTTAYANGTQRVQSYDIANRLTGTGTSLGATTITGRGYTLDTMGRRTAYVDETAATAAFGYDAAGQVLSGTVPVPGSGASTSTSTYTYDQEGNRTAASLSGTPVTYATNSLNQYTAISTDPAPAYDLDGNQTVATVNPQFGASTTPLAIANVWDGENRLISSTPTAPNLGDRAVTNTYDALSRRVKKTTSEWTVSGWTVVETRHFTYHTWNPIEETITHAGGPTQLAENLWGTDLSGSEQGVGGVGGLLQRTTASAINYYHYDGNGNITALTDLAGTVAARYTYGEFGTLLAATGTGVANNPFRYSTKYQDDETGLLYYGYRFYNPVKGRWLSRDPISEAGGINIYEFTHNCPISKIDTDGRWVWFATPLILLAFNPDRANAPGPNDGILPPHAGPVGMLGDMFMGAAVNGVLKCCGVITGNIKLYIWKRIATNTVNKSPKGLSAVVGAIDARTGAIVVANSSAKSPITSPELVKIINNLGGLGARPLCKYPLGCCAEVHAADKLLKAGSRLGDIRFTKVIRPGTPKIHAPCKNCEAMFSKNLKAWGVPTDMPRFIFVPTGIVEETSNVIGVE